MTSVADDLRWATRSRILELSIEERLLLVGRLAAADLDLDCAANGASRDDGRRVFERQRQVGRLASRVMAGASE